MHTRTVSIALSGLMTVSLCAGLAAPAMAIAANEGSITASSTCEGKTGQTLGRCMSDVQKAMIAALKEFTEKQEAERIAWKDEHASMGQTDEYQKLLRAFFAEQKKALDAFKAKALDTRRTINTNRKTVRSSVKTKAKGYSRTIRKAETAKASDACKDVDEDLMRTCLREQLKIRDPNAKNWRQR